MIKTNTVLILGAGASIPFGFPSGIRLKDNICKFLNEGFYRDILKQRFAEGEIDLFIHELMRSPDYSVDHFLEYRPKCRNIGKQCIALAILPHECTQRLFDDWGTLRSGGQTPLQSKDGNNWYQYLFDRLMTSFDRFGDNSLSVITFNYDRSLEHYLFTSLKNKYNKSDSECAAQLEKIPIIHVHGQLGRLSWTPQDIPVVLYDIIEDTGSQYRNAPNLDGSARRRLELRALSHLVGQAAGHIKIIHEDDVADAFAGAHEILRNATRIYFLGFGFNETNVLRLLPEDVRKKNNMRGTCLGISPHVRRKLVQIGMPTMGLRAQVSSATAPIDGGYFRPMTNYQFLYNDSYAVLD